MTDQPATPEPTPAAVSGALARAEALAAGHPEWMTVTRWPEPEPTPQPGPAGIDYLMDLLDDDTGITWLCDLGQHDECDGYACVCCGHGHPGVRARPTPLPTADPCPGCGRTNCTALNHR